MCAVPHGIWPGALHMGTITRAGGGLHAARCPLQIGPTWPSSSPQPSKHPFPPPIITVNHSDSPVHGLSLRSGVVILLYQPDAGARGDKHHRLSSGVQSAGSSLTARTNTDTRPFAKFPRESSHKTKLGSRHGLCFNCDIRSGISCRKSRQD